MSTGPGPKPGPGASPCRHLVFRPERIPRRGPLDGFRARWESELDVGSVGGVAHADRTQ
jgi:hypothetical protein